MKKKHLTYVYQNGRKNRLAKENYPKEFFYGLDFLKSQFETFDVIEFSKDNNNIILEKFSKFIERITGLPYLFDKIVSSINFKIFKKVFSVSFIKSSYLTKKYLLNLLKTFHELK